tara:strand:- start:564 stop:1721 length:1158 start_codon:yes stop_codon:yes gene_type:complete
MAKKKKKGNKKNVKKTQNAKKTQKKIAITMGHPSHLWSNGLHQNAVFLGRLLKKAGYSVELLSHDKDDDIKVKELGGVKLRTFKDIHKAIVDYDVIICVSVSLPESAYKLAKEKGIKMAITEYGNLYQIFIESALMMGVKDFGVDGKKYDQADALWVSPHYERNRHWYKSFTDQNFVICPYVWEPLFFDLKCKDFKGDPKWSPEKNVKNIAIHEPNINIQKNCIIPLAITGLVNKRDPNMIDAVFALNTEKIKDNKPFIEYIQSIGLIGKGSFDSRRTTPFMACQNIMGTSVLHHANNSLNYLTLELLRLGYPVVHNSEEMKEAGYFYNEINVVEGADQLELAINTHADNVKVKQEQADEILWKYAADNPKNIQGYKDLVEKLFD